MLRTRPHSREARRRRPGGGAPVSASAGASAPIGGGRYLGISHGDSPREEQARVEEHEQPEQDAEGPEQRFPGRLLPPPFGGPEPEVEDTDESADQDADDVIEGQGQGREGARPERASAIPATAAGGSRASEMPIPTRLS